jgi:hypothetical protein
MNGDVLKSLAWAGGMIGLALGANLARKLGYIDADTVTRMVVGINGLMVAWFGNRMPKAVVPVAGVRRQVMRVGGWAMVLSGLVYAGTWAFAPIPVAIWVGCGAIVAGMAVTIGYSVWLRARTKAA